jgi:hypothetical protein
LVHFLQHDFARVLGKGEFLDLPSSLAEAMMKSMGGLSFDCDEVDVHALGDLGIVLVRTISCTSMRRFQRTACRRTLPPIDCSADRGPTIY